jgi:hypothetical protein
MLQHQSQVKQYQFHAEKHLSQLKEQQHQLKQKVTD